MAAALLAVFLGGAAVAQVELADKAMELANRGDVQGSIDLLEAARPLDEATSAILGSVYLLAGRADDALQVLDPLAARADATAPVLYGAGLAAKLSGDSRKAVGYLSRSEQLAPESRAAKELGVLLLSLGEYEAAYPLLIGWSRSHPQDSTVRLLAALTAVELERTSEAEQLLEELPADDSRVLMLHGKILLQRGDDHGGLEYFERAAQDAPSEMQADLDHTMADAYLRTGQPQKVIELLEGRVGDDIGLAIKLSDAFEQSGYPAAAASALKRFIEPLITRLDELPPELTRNAGSMARRYGRLILSSGKADDAVVYLEAAARLQPDDVENWQSLGEAFEAAGRSADAARARARALSGASVASEPDPTGLAVVRAMEIAREQPQEALVQLHYAHLEAPGDPRPTLIASRLLLSLGRPEDALAAIEKTAEAGPLLMDTVHQKGAVLQALGRAEEAAELFGRVLDQDPGHLPTLNDFAVLLIDLGRTEEAKSLVDRALEIDPNDPATRFNLRRLEQQP